MKPKWVGLTVVVAAFAAVVVYKGVAGDSRAPTPVSSATTKPPSVVLIADPREAESACGCGQIIRTVRAAGSRGVSVTEAEPGSETARSYRATVNPTVLFLDADGDVQSRYEGEQASTIGAIETELNQLGAGHR